MKYTQIPNDTFENIQLNAGIICEGFNPATGEVTGLIGATTGGLQFKDAPEYVDFGEDIDNCPKNTKELKRVDNREVTLAGTLVTISAQTAKKLMGSADIDEDDATHVIPRDDLVDADFDDTWFVGDYSDKNTGANAGYCAIHLMNTLNTEGLQLQTEDKKKGQFAFSYLAHYSIDDMDTVPYEVYIKKGTA